MQQQKKGVLAVLSGFSGAGKGTVTRELIKRYDKYLLSVSATTRNPREGEVNGVHYFFKTKEEFEKMIQEGAFLEYATYVGNYYGTPKDWVFEKLEAGKNVILEIDVNGALQVKKKYPEAVLVFLTTKDIPTLKERLIGRGTETMEVIKERLKQAAGEARLMPWYDLLLVNDDLDTCVKELDTMLTAMGSATENNKELISSLQEELFKEESTL